MLIEISCCNKELFVTTQNLWLSLFLSYFTCHPKEPITKQTLISVALDNFAKKLIAAALTASFEALTILSTDKWKEILRCASLVDMQSGNFVSFKTCFQSNELSLWKSNKLGAACQENEAVCLKLQDESKYIPGTVAVLKTEVC